MTTGTTGRPARVRRAEAQAEIAAEADRIRCALGVDQADLADAIGTGPTHVQHLLARREAHTVTLADVVSVAEERALRAKTREVREQCDRVDDAIGTPKPRLRAVAR